MAFSSYSENGWSVKDGAIRTRQLRSYFIEKMGTPRRIYLAGVSEGALIATKLAEQNPELFDGVLAVAGPLGGAGKQFDYVVNVRLAFDFFFKTDILFWEPTDPNYMPACSLANALGYYQNIGVLDLKAPEDILRMSEFSALFYPLILQMLGENPMDTMGIMAVTADGEYLFPFMEWQSNVDSVYELAYTLTTALWYSIYATEDLIARTHHKSPLTNMDTLYTPGELNDQVERFDSHRSAVQYLKHWYEPSGDLMIPMVMVHLTRDPAVPYSHSLQYAAQAYPMAMLIPGTHAFGHAMVITFDGGIPRVEEELSIGNIIMGFSTLYSVVNSVPVP